MTHYTTSKEPLGPQTLAEWANRGWMLMNHWTTWDFRSNRHCYVFMYVGRS
jgi:hypothetical protein